MVRAEFVMYPFLVIKPDKYLVCLPSRGIVFVIAHSLYVIPVAAMAFCITCIPPPSIVLALIAVGLVVARAPVFVVLPVVVYDVSVWVLRL